MGVTMRVGCGLAAAVLLVGCGDRGTPGQKAADRAQRVRQKAAEQVRRAVASVDQPKDLARIVREEANRDLRLAALEKLTDQRLLAELVAEGADMEARQRAVLKVTDPQLLVELQPWTDADRARAETNTVLLATLATRAWLAPIRKIAVEKTADAALLARVALTDPSAPVRKAAALGLSDPSCLQRMATNDPAWYVRRAAADRIADESLLAAIAQEDPDAAVSRAALVRLTNETAVLDVALRNTSPGVRARALAKLVSDESLAAFVRMTHDLDLQAQAYDRMKAATRLKAEVAPWMEAPAAEATADQALLATLAEKALRADVRRTAVGRLADQAVLGRVALSDAAEEVRQAAAARLEDQAGLRAVARQGRDSDARAVAIAKLNDPVLLLDVIGRSNEVFGVRQAAVRALKGEANLKKLAEDPDLPDGLRAEAVAGVHDQDFLARRIVVEDGWATRGAIERSLTNSILRNRVEPWIKESATQSVTDPTLLTRIAVEALNVGVRASAVARLTDRSVLSKLAIDTNCPPSVRSAAVGRLDDQVLLASLVNDTNVPRLVRAAAVKQIGSQAELAAIATHDGWDDDIRAEAVERLADTSRLASIAGSTNAPVEVRLAAVKRMDDQESLARIAIGDADSRVRKAAEGRLSDESIRARIRPWSNSQATQAVTDPALLARIARQSHVQSVRKTAVDALSDPAVLGDVALKDADKDVRAAALRRVTDPSVLARVAEKDVDADNRRLATERISDQSLLTSIARNDRHNDVRQAAIERMTNQVVLSDLARTEANDKARLAAFARMTDAMLLETTAPWVKPEAVRTVSDRFLLARMTRTAGDTKVRAAAMSQLAGDTNQPPAVAYEWLAHLFQKEGKPDDAVLAMLMATVAYDQAPGQNSELSLATFERALELRGLSAVQQGVSALKADAPAGGKLSLSDVVAAVNDASRGPLNCREEQLVVDVTREFRQILSEKKSDSETTSVHYATGDIAFSSALGLAMIRRRDDWPYIERYLASDAYHPRFAGYLGAMAASDASFEQMLLAHPSAMIRANAVIALEKAAPDGEKDLLVRCAGAWHPAGGATNEAIRLLQGALDDERHVVRVMALRGLAKHGVAVPLETVKRTIASTDAWRRKYTLGCMVFFITSAVDPSLNGRQFTFPGSTYSEQAVDCTLLQAGYGLVGGHEALSDEAFDWLLQQLKLSPGDGYPVFHLSSASDREGYRVEFAQPLTADRLNADVLLGLAKHAPSHSGRLLAALRQADPYGRLILLQATERIATNSEVRALLWRIAEGEGQAAEQAAYREEIYTRKVAEVSKGLGWNQTVNYSAVREYAETLAGLIWKQSRRISISQLAATAEDTAELERLGALLSDGDSARGALLALLSRGPDTLAAHAPADLLTNTDAEVRMCAAIARLTREDVPEARTALASALKGDDDRISFAARLALQAQTPALREAVRSVRVSKPVSVAGYLVRRVATESR